MNGSTVAAADTGNIVSTTKELDLGISLLGMITRCDNAVIEVDFFPNNRYILSIIVFYLILKSPDFLTTQAVTQERYNI